MKYKKRGVTLVELLLTVALIGTVMLVISNFFFANFKALSRESDEIDFQREGEKALSFIISEAIPSKGIKKVYINNTVINIENVSNALNISRLVLDFDGEEEKGFKVINNGEGKQLYYYISKDNVEISKVIISNLIKSLDISSDSSLKNTSNIRLKITLTKGRNPVIESEAYFRNKSKGY